MALSAETQVTTRPLGWLTMPVADNVIIYKGARVMVVGGTGYATPAADTSGGIYVGIARETVDNTVSGHTAGGVSVTIERAAAGATLDALHEITMATSIAQSAVGKFAYLVSDNTADVVANSTNKVVYGRILSRINSTTAIVDTSDRWTLAVLL